MLDFLKRPVMTVQDFFIMSGRAAKSVFQPPHYVNDLLMQMDIIGVGSLSIVILVSFASGLIITMQMARALQQYGATGQVGQIVAITLVRELGPLLTAIVVAGRNASGIASELGSMKVTEQIDAMRALGTDPIQKLVKPRMLAFAVMLPCLTIIADFVGMAGGFLIAYFTLNLSYTQYWTTAYQALEYNDLAQGLLKPFVFAFVISLVGCYYGMRTTGGTQGVGRSTTQAVVVASVWVFFVTSLITRIFVNMQ
ncbi:MAG TPA: ABC transporter permease [Bryobacteraceae bacterium]|nr:ABC transporter permease [Bryobacteraceae bacterium]